MNYSTRKPRIRLPTSSQQRKNQAAHIAREAGTTVLEQRTPTLSTQARTPWSDRRSWCCKRHWRLDTIGMAPQPLVGPCSNAVAGTRYKTMHGGCMCTATVAAVTCPWKSRYKCWVLMLSEQYQPLFSALFQILEWPDSWLSSGPFLFPAGNGSFSREECSTKTLGRGGGKAVFKFIPGNCTVNILISPSHGWLNSGLDLS